MSAPEVGIPGADEAENHDDSDSLAWSPVGSLSSPRWDAETKVYGRRYDSATHLPPRGASEGDTADLRSLSVNVHASDPGAAAGAVHGSGLGGGFGWGPNGGSVLRGLAVSPALRAEARAPVWQREFADAVALPRPGVPPAPQLSPSFPMRAHAELNVSRVPFRTRQFKAAWGSTGGFTAGSPVAHGPPAGAQHSPAGAAREAKAAHAARTSEHVCGGLMQPAHWRQKPPAAAGAAAGRRAAAAAAGGGGGTPRKATAASPTAAAAASSR